MELALFIPAAALALTGAMGMIASHRPVHSVLWMLLSFSAIAVLYLVLAAQFIAVLQVIIYAGAIVVLFLFVIMLLHMEMGEAGREPLPALRSGGLVVGGLLLAGLVYSILRGSVGPRAVPAPDFGTAEAVGRALFTRFLLPFELTSVILLVGIIGAVVLAKGVLPLTVRVRPARAVGAPEEPVAPTAVQR